MTFYWFFIKLMNSKTLFENWWVQPNPSNPCQLRPLLYKALLFLQYNPVPDVSNKVCWFQSNSFRVSGTCAKTIFMSQDQRTIEWKTFESSQYFSSLKQMFSLCYGIGLWPYRKSYCLLQVCSPCIREFDPDMLLWNPYCLTTTTNMVRKLSLYVITFILYGFFKIIGP